MLVSKLHQHQTVLDSEHFWASWRRNFPALERLTYLNTSSHGLQSEAVRNAYSDYLESWRFDAPWESTWQQQLHDILELCADLFISHSSNFCIMPSATTALQAVLSAIPVIQGKNEVLISQFDWVSNHHVLASDSRFNVKVIAAQPDTDVFLSQISERTCLVIMSHICYQTGYRSDLKTVADASHKQDARVFADLYQSAGAVKINLDESDIDFATTGFLKYLLGSPGVAILYVRPGLAEHLKPSLSGWRGQSDPMTLDFQYAAGAARFSGGTWPIPSLYAAGAGLNLILGVGIEKIEDRIAALGQLFKAACVVRKISLLSPESSSHSTPVVSICLHHATEYVEELKRKTIHCSARGQGLRFSFHAYNNEQDIEHTFDVLDTLLSQTVKGMP